MISGCHQLDALKTQPSQSRAFVILSAMLLAAVAAILLKPSQNIEGQYGQVDLETLIPKQFGDWNAVSSNLVQTSLSIRREGEATAVNPYDDILMRTYENSEGRQMMLALAWGKTQRQEVKVHRPEKCYTAQGFKVQGLIPTVFNNIKGASTPVIGKRMIALGGHRKEAVSYWIRLGDIFPSTGLETRMKIFNDGLRGKLNDGILVRASTVINQESEASEAYREQEKFLGELVNNVGELMPDLLVPFMGKFDSNKLLLKQLNILK
mgnify:CR=1 FL=1